jgi:transposase-like protein
MEKRNRYASEFKAKVVLELLREGATLSQVASSISCLICNNL